MALVKCLQVLCERGYLLAAKMYLDKAFNVKEIVQHFACMYPGCMKPLLTSTTPCKCSGEIDYRYTARCLV